MTSNSSTTRVTEGSPTMRDRSIKWRSLGLHLLGPLLLFCASGSTRAHELHFVTEGYPPYSFRENDQLKGYSVDLVKAIMKDSGIGYTIEVMPWARAQALASLKQDYCVFTTVHTPERDKKFKWVEPILRSTTLLIRKTGSGVDPKTLQEAKAFRVGTQREDFTQTFLEKNRFPKIDIATDLGLSMKKLLSGRIDLLPVSDQYYAKLRRDKVDVEAVMPLAETISSIACNRMIGDTTIAAMQKQLDRLTADGTQARIFREYGLTTYEGHGLSAQAGR